MPGMKLNAVKTSLPGPIRGFYKPLNHLLDFFSRQFPGQNSGNWVINCGRSQGLLAAQSRPGLPSGVGNLKKNERTGAALVDSLSQSAQTRNFAVIINCYLARAGLPRRVNIGMPGDDKTYLTFSQSTVELQLSRADIALLVIGQVVVGGRANEPVDKAQSADVDGCEQTGSHLSIKSKELYEKTG